MVFNAQPGDIVFSMVAAWVAKLNSDNTFGTPAQIGYVQDFDFQPEHDEDMIKALGANVEALKILIGGSLTMGEAAMAYEPYSIITGDSNSQSSGASGLITTKDTEAGGEGVPYVGVVGIFASTFGARYVFGVPKAKSTKPSFSVEQNTFRTGELNFGVVVPKLPPAPLYRERKYEAASDVPDFSSATEWDTYFSGMFS